MRVRIKRGLSCLLLLALLLSALSCPAWAEGIEELELEQVEITAGDTPGDEDGVTEAPEGDPIEPEPDAAIIPDESADGAPEDGDAQSPAEPDPPAEPDGGSEPDPEEPGDTPAEPAAESPKPDEAQTRSDVPTPESAELPAPARAGSGDEVRLYAELTVGENFDLSLYIALPADADPAQYRVRTVFSAQMSARTIDRALSADDKEGGLYVIPDICEARVYQLTAPIDITVSRNGTELRHEVYRVRDYLEDLAGLSAQYTKFCVAALCYGGAAQRWLDGRSFTWNNVDYPYEVFADDYADKNLRVPEPPYPLPDPSIPLRDTVYTGSIQSLGNLAARFQIGLDTALRFYFSFPQTPSSVVFTSGDHSFSEPAVQASSFWYVDMPGILATELANDFVVDVALDYQKMSILYSPFCYAAQHWYSDDAKLASLCRMLVAFGNEAADLAAAVKE